MYIITTNVSYQYGQLWPIHSSCAEPTCARSVNNSYKQVGGSGAQDHCQVSGQFLVNYTTISDPYILP